MLFNSIEFWLFLAVVLAVHYALPRAARKYWLLAASYFFYMSWNAVFVALLLTLTVTDYFCALMMERFSDPARKRAFLVLSLAVNLGFLGYFKYYNFLAGTLAELGGLAANTWASNIILPLGISFHTFQSMSYLVDVYRGEQAAIRKLPDYALFIAFFPQLVAGPIVRAGEFFEGLYRWRPPSEQERLHGVLLLALGLAKKMALADQFAQVADAYFQNPAAQPGMVAAWCGTVSFALQIFFDFSGYTDMAIGMALLLGFHFPVNFRRPYLAFSITDFWHRWHISLSRWLRDFLYIPLGGNRGGAWFTYRNLLITMLLGGLWHGASWNFVIWGGFHGGLLALERGLGRGLFEQKPSPMMYPFRALLTFVLVCCGWVFFRASTLPDSWYVIVQLFTGARQGSISVIPIWLRGLAAGSLLIAILEERFAWIDRLAAGRRWVHAAGYATSLVVLGFCIEVFGFTDKTVPFVYFQF